MYFVVTSKRDIIQGTREPLINRTAPAGNHRNQHGGPGDASGCCHGNPAGCCHGSNSDGSHSDGPSNAQKPPLYSNCKNFVFLVKFAVNYCQVLSNFD